jgi:hypothetical protein
MLERAEQQTDAVDETGGSDAASPLICVLPDHDAASQVMGARDG